MIVKMIQNPENKMELQVNRLETSIEKMPQMFNKDLEEIKKSQSIMNNAITKIKSTLEGTNSRITEAEDRISEVEVEWWKQMNQRGKKRIKSNVDNLRDLCHNVRCPSI